ncbi:methyltransferase, partial [Fusobacterium nucleatum CC53]
DNMKNYLKYFNMSFFDIIISNPPFFKINENVNFLNNLEQLSIARHEVEIDLDELIKISSELVKDRGYFYLVHRADRLSEILNILQKYKFEAKKIKFCYTTKYKNAKIVLIEAIKNGKSGLTILPPLIINKENGEYTDEVLKMFE